MADGGVAYSDLADLIATTLTHFVNDRVNVVWDKQRVEGAHVYKDMRIELDGGTSIDRQVIFTKGGNAKYFLPYQEDTPNVDNAIKKINVPWVRLGTVVAYDTHELKAQMSNRRGFINLISTRMLREQWGLINLLSKGLFRTPVNANSALDPFGVPYYFPLRDNSSTGAGFDGQTIRFRDSTTSTTAAGIDANTTTEWKSYAATYTAIDDEFLRILDTAILQTNFEAPPLVSTEGLDVPDLMFTPDTRIYMGTSNFILLKHLMNKFGDNHSPKDVFQEQLTSNAGSISFSGIKVIRIPDLDDTSQSPDFAFAPVYGVDWRALKPVVLAGTWRERTGPKPSGTQHTVIETYEDITHNNLLENRKTGFALHTVTS